MSVTSPRPEARPAGFTLLELVVVLAVIALATALVAPQGFRMIESWRRATEADAVLGTMAAVGARARQQGQVLRFPSGPVDPGNAGGFPEGWSVVLSEPLVVHANGACSGTRGEMRAGDYARDFTLQAPFCRVVLDKDAP